MTATLPRNAGGTQATAMTKGRQADSARRRQRVITAISQATAAGTEISVSGIARTAAVDRTFLYRHRDLLEKIHALEAAPPAGTGTPARASPARPCKPISSPPTNAPCGSPPAPASSKNGSPKRSASKPGVNQGSAHPPTSTPSTRKSPTSNSKQPTCSSSSTNATRTSTQPAPPTASS